ncbi:MAG: hypothetical protein KDD42_03550, partial [Bdellovibrionales bacterium]|nr:hypothetical protein [Bdellovibrionales bacterium]
MLDNFHVIEEQARDIRKHLPRSYYRGLPRLTNSEFVGYPRVYSLAHQYLAHSDAVVSDELLSVFIAAYQERTSLMIGELWAVPIMLRLALIENLRRLTVANLEAQRSSKVAQELSDQVLGDELRSGTDLLLELGNKIRSQPELLHSVSGYLMRRLRGKGSRAVLAQQWLEERLKEEGIEPEDLNRQASYQQAANQISIGNTITSLKFVNTFNWRRWVEHQSCVEKTLSKDAAQVYSQSDFATRDLCRHRIERYARRLERPEVEIANEVLALAEKADLPGVVEVDEDCTKSVRERHVGYYLIGAGQQELENVLSYRPCLSERAKRLLKCNAVTLYLSAIVVTSLLIATGLILLTRDQIAPLVLSGLLVLALTPVSSIAIDIVQWLVTRLVAPTILPKFQFDEGIPASCRTIVVVHTIAGDKQGIRNAIEQLEVRFLANIDNNIYFALLADLPDSPSKEMPSDRDLEEFAKELIHELNDRHASREQPKFFLLFRERRWNQSEHKFMGWERKRGKLTEFNQLITGRNDTSLAIKVGDLDILHGIRYVITLDADSQLPRGAARKLVATISHPLNHPRFDRNGLVVEGYGIIQPRVGIALNSSYLSPFTRLFSGHAGLDPYTCAVSDVYQDLFSEGSYIGKGIYDVQTFSKALENRVPDNALLSHDLFEGIFARVALATDIELLDDFPPRFNVFASRQHRWVRGDWQLLPWLRRYVPHQKQRRMRNPISALGRWKLLDNLRRSLMAPSSFLLLVFTWFLVPSGAFIWIGCVVVAYLFGFFTTLINSILLSRLEIFWGVYVRGLKNDLLLSLGRGFFSLAVLPYKAYLMCHAIVITLWRIVISKRNLLVWQTASAAERKLGSGLMAFVMPMCPAILLTASIHYLLLAIESPHFAFATPFLALWYVSPLLAWRLSQPYKRRQHGLRRRDREYLGRLAWDTWRYFEEHCNADNNFLIPDNLQLVPDIKLARRTSPTNLGLSLLSVVGSYDLGFLPLSEVIDRLERSLGSIAKLERYKGHLFNWYETSTRRVLSPRYISTVDSGNFIASLLVCRVAVKDFIYKPLFSQRHWRHLALLLDELSALFESRSDSSLRVVQALRRKALSVPRSLEDTVELLSGLENVLAQLPKLSFQQGQAQSLEREALSASVIYEIESFVSAREFFSWSTPLEHFWKKLSELPGATNLAGFAKVERRLKGVHNIIGSRALSISLLYKLHRRLSASLRKFRDDNSARVSEFPDLWPFIENLEQELMRCAVRLETVLHDQRRILEICDSFIREVNFVFLYDHKKDLFSVGYNVDEARGDQSFYDLLASECRLASLVAIS